MSGKWIWTHTEFKKDDYAEFFATFHTTQAGTILLRIACDSVYNVFVNRHLVAFSGCADFPWFKVYDEIDLTPYCEQNNELKIIVWHYGEDSQTYINDEAGLIFEVVQGEETLLSSSEETLSREMNEYKNGYCKRITEQLGFSYLYDNSSVKSEYGKSRLVDKPYCFHLRPIEGLQVKNRLPIAIIKRTDSILIDMGREVAGFLEMEFDSPCRQLLTVAYGEHITDGGVRRRIGSKDFSVEFVAKKGENSAILSLRRIAGRYLEIFCEEDISIGYIGIRPVEYPFVEREAVCRDRETQRIYDVCVDTLRLCAHEHYEDCPWREQALYAMDSRNQMLCGYYVFEGTAYQRYNLLLISKSLRPDGLLSICAPAGRDIPIPFFSLIYLIQLCEYVQNTHDNGILDEVREAAESIIAAFDRHKATNGLIAAFPYPYWNFYEWTEGSSNEWQIDRKPTEEYGQSYDLILNCMYVYAMREYSKVTGRQTDWREVKERISQCFYRNGRFELSTQCNKASQLGNALALLIGLGDRTLAEQIVVGEMIPASLSMRTFVYDALLMFGDEYREYILTDIRRTYGAMLAKGATSFWETESGEADFGGMGSLCHGWSAMPICYFHRLGVADYGTKKIEI